jgi:hypothetical protein
MQAPGGVSGLFCAAEDSPVLKTLRYFCIALGIAHAIAMTLFACGPELSPLMVTIVDAPIAFLTAGATSRVISLGIPIFVCSLAYPFLLYSLSLLGRRLRRGNPPGYQPT